MNILFTSVGNFLTLESEACLEEWRARYHAVEQMPIERLVGYLRFGLARSLALVDAIVCMADSDLIADYDDRHSPTLDFPLEKALTLAEDVHNLPEICTMRDGRKWRSIPFVIFCGLSQSGSMLLKQRSSHAHVYPLNYPLEALSIVQGIVDEDQDRVLNEYRNFGILVRFKKGRAQIGPALQRKANLK